MKSQWEHCSLARNTVLRVRFQDYDASLHVQLRLIRPKFVWKGFPLGWADMLERTRDLKSIIPRCWRMLDSDRAKGVDEFSVIADLSEGSESYVPLICHCLTCLYGGNRFSGVPRKQMFSLTRHLWTSQVSRKGPDPWCPQIRQRDPRNLEQT